MLNGTYKTLYDKLVGTIDKKRIFHDPLHTLAYGTDASFYRLIPKMVIRAKDENEISLILKNCSELEIPVTFRAAGTSLSGQAISDSVLIIAGSNWKKYSISNDGSEIKLQPGITGGRANLILAPLGRKIGPDPASINSAMIGGIAANNASGMCCGTSQNSYKTVAGMRVILADGSVLDTRDPASRELFSKSHGTLLSEIGLLAVSAKDNSFLAERIRNKYKMKNTTGYSLNALTDFTDPFDIIEHLMIGSEGTLGFISEISFKTVAEQPCKASSLMLFPDVEKACNAVSLMKQEPVSAVELIDRSGIRSVENEKGLPEYLKYLHNDVCALLVETTGENKSEITGNIIKICNAIKDLPVEREIAFTDKPAEYELLWKIRKGLFPSVGAMRKSGTTVIIEDVAFPVPRLAEATTDLQNLLKKYNYTEAVIFGHALEGNLHFVFTQDFGDKEEISRYAGLMSDVADLVVKKYDGSLKAEHGTGRNMAPFVEMEWGKDAYNLMKEIKRIFDPLFILNPGVILNTDKDVHLKDLKPLPVASEIIDKCTECGFCEASCVSADLTLTPRQRIVVHREIKSLEKSGHQPHIAASLNKEFKYHGDATCATDGLCAQACPVKIDTGKLIKNLRSEEASASPGIANWIADHMGFITSAARGALSFVNFVHRIIGSGLLGVIASGMRVISFNRIPAWNRFMPKGSAKIDAVSGRLAEAKRKVVYFPSCINRSMGTSQEYSHEKQLSEKLVQLLHRGGYEVVFPANMDNLCCGMAFLSKGYVDAGTKKSKELENELLKASNNGEYPVLCDMSPCLYTMKENMQSGIKLYEPVEFILDFLVPNLNITPLNEVITVFPVCSMKKMGLEKKLVALANLCAAGVVVPEANCCGFAGDRGFTFPELNTHGLRDLKVQLPETINQGYSNSRTCEIGLSLHSGISYKSIVYLVDKVSNPITHMD
ncbi:MAG: FAD-binding oxidoreductase [Bacteroidales bacterium]|nr:FAD-binding oxidoreductase [Bacteroidales bacterium]